MKYAQDFTETGLVMVDNKGNKESFAYVAAIPETDAIGALQVEMRQRGDVTAAALSLMVQILDNPRFDTYKGKTPMGEKHPKELKAAIREEEEKHLKPLFMAAFMKKSKKADAAAQGAAWDSFIGELRAGGIYGNVKSRATQYLGYFGKLPCVYDAEGHADKSKLLAVSAMDKLIANAKTDLPTKAEGGISDELVKLAADLSTDKAKPGQATTALAALKAMIVKYEALQQQEAEAAQRKHELTKVGDVSKVAADAVKKASKPRRVKKEEAALM